MPHPVSSADNQTPHPEVHKKAEDVPKYPCNGPRLLTPGHREDCGSIRFYEGKGSEIHRHIHTLSSSG